jgi:glycosyltransferase involved in cell wall biosynthesis
MAHVTADYVLLTLPARSWKKRMQLAAPWFAAEVSRMEPSVRQFDVVLASTFVDVALLKSMLLQLPGWNHATRFLTYFHENQFAYPDRFADPNIRQFQYINFTTGLASDRICFNSRYNRDTFMAGCARYLDKAADMAASETLSLLQFKSDILPPGMTFGEGELKKTKESGAPPVIIWNHRWEHDKGPEEFFSALFALERQGVDFRLILLGQSFTTSPPCFLQAQKNLGDKIVHCGYVESRAEYRRLLEKGDIVVSTARHEFFGLAVLEAVRAGCRPLLPRRLSYPELFPDEVLYGEHELAERLFSVIQQPQPLQRENVLQYTEPFGWDRVADLYREWLFG